MRGREVLHLLTILLAFCLISGSSVALAQDTAGLADSPWPKFKRDAQNTGYSPNPSIIEPFVKWTYPTGHYVRSSPVIAPDGTIYVGSEDHWLYALNRDGTFRWSFSTWGQINAGAPAIASDGTVYVGSIDTVSYFGRLYAISPEGTLKWTFDAGSAGHDSLSPTVGPDGAIYFGSRQLYALNPDGSTRWAYNVGHSIDVTPALAPDGTIYVLASDARLYAVNPDGTLKWVYATSASPSGNLWSSPSVGPEGTIYFGTAREEPGADGDNSVYAVNPDDGSLKWTFQANHVVRRSPTIAPDGTIYVGEDAYTSSAPQEGFRLYALNPDGSLKWDFEPYSIVGSSVSLASDGTLYFASAGRFYALSPEGTVEWELTLGGNVHESTPAVDVDGTIYVGSYDNSLYAIGGEIRSLTATVEIVPGTISVMGKGPIKKITKDKGLTAFIELPEGYSVSQIDISTVAVTSVDGLAIPPIHAALSPSVIGDHDGDSNPDLMVKFSRKALKQYLAPPEAMIEISGQLTNGIPFQGSFLMRVR